MASLFSQLPTPYGAVCPIWQIMRVRPPLYEERVYLDDERRSEWEHLWSRADANRRK
jgi:hypothetical protein